MRTWLRRSWWPVLGLGLAGVLSWWVTGPIRPWWGAFLAAFGIGTGIGLASIHAQLWWEDRQASSQDRRS